MPDAPPLHWITADLTFTLRQDAKPWFESSAVTGGAPRVHFRTESRPVSIHDMRMARDRLSLDTTGFELHRHETAVDDLDDDGAPAAAYDAETADLLKRLLGADMAVVFDRTRRSDAGAGAANPDGRRLPASRVHVDYTDSSGPKRARDALGGETVDRILGGGGRIVQINVWRPIRGPVLRSPLALADAGSIPKEDLLATDQVFPDRVGEIYQLAWSPAHRWYWAPRMARNEVLLIKGWDSLDDGRARYTPHGAFALPDQDPAAPPRASIELRAFVAFEG